MATQNIKKYSREEIEALRIQASKDDAGLGLLFGSKHSAGSGESIEGEAQNISLGFDVGQFYGHKSLGSLGYRLALDGDKWRDVNVSLPAGFRGRR